MKNKICKGQCHQLIEENNLAIHHIEKDGKKYYRSYCVPCWTIYERDRARKYQNENKEKYQAYQKNYRKINEKTLKSKESTRKGKTRRDRKKIVLEKYGNKCENCGIS